MMKLREEVVMPYSTGKSFIVKQGQRIRINAETIVDFIPFNLDNMREMFDQARSKAHNGQIFLSTGNKLFTKFANPIMLIGEDTYPGNHDLQYGMCSKVAYDGFWESIKKQDPVFLETFAWRGVTKREDLPDHGCWENMQDALQGYNIAPENIPSPFNLFQNMELVGPRGKLQWRLLEKRPEPGKQHYTDLTALMNCLCAISACPEFGLGKAVTIQIFDE